jgi:predicted nucleotide-binding protein
MKLQITFRGLRFPESVVRRAIAAMDALSEKREAGGYYSLTLYNGDESWELEHPEDFFAGYESATYSNLHYGIRLKSDRIHSFTVHTDSRESTISVGAESRNDINTVMNIFRGARDQAINLPSPDPEYPMGQRGFSVFIGHGRSEAWQQLNNHLRDKHGLDVISYESGARAGHHIRDILDEMLDNSSIAFLVHTGEDETAEEKVRARQNVIHETGLFQGRLGFSKAIVLLEDGVEQLSNLDGIQYIPFQKGNIKSTFGDVLATIRRERQRKENS